MKIEVVLAISRIVLLFVAVSLITLIIFHQTLKQDKDKRLALSLNEVHFQNDSTPFTLLLESRSQNTLGKYHIFY